MLIKKCPETDLSSVRIEKTGIDYNGLMIDSERDAEEENLLHYSMEANKIDFKA